MSDAEIIQAQAAENASLRAALAESKTETAELSDWVYRLETSGPHAKLAADIHEVITALRGLLTPNSGGGYDWMRLKLSIATLECVHEALTAAAPAAATPAAEPQGVGEAE